MCSSRLYATMIVKIEIKFKKHRINEEYHQASQKFVLPPVMSCVWNKLNLKFRKTLFRWSGSFYAKASTLQWALKQQRIALTKLRLKCSRFEQVLHMIQDIDWLQRFNAHPWTSLALRAHVAAWYTLTRTCLYSQSKLSNAVTSLATLAYRFRSLAKNKWQSVRFQLRLCWLLSFKFMKYALQVRRYV